MDNIERRAFSVQMEIRADEDGQKIEGHAAVFDKEIDFLFSREVIRAGAFTRALEEKQDVRALFNHNPDHVLGRTTAGTVQLSEDDKGLKTIIEPPDTQLVMS